MIWTKGMILVTRRRHISLEIFATLKICVRVQKPLQLTAAPADRGIVNVITQLKSFVASAFVIYFVYTKKHYIFAIATVHVYYLKAV